jgi:hypothetical protein
MIVSGHMQNNHRSNVNSNAQSMRDTTEADPYQEASGAKHTWRDAILHHSDMLVPRHLFSRRFLFDRLCNLLLPIP